MSNNKNNDSLFHLTIFHLFSVMFVQDVSLFHDVNPEVPQNVKYFVVFHRLTVVFDSLRNGVPNVFKKALSSVTAGKRTNRVEHLSDALVVAKVVVVFVRHDHHFDKNGRHFPDVSRIFGQQFGLEIVKY